jgi:hypothetical protein
MDSIKLHLLSIGFLHANKAGHMNHCIKVEATCCCFPGKHILLLRPFWHGHAAIPSRPFCMTATIYLACLQCLAPLLAETAGTCCQKICSLPSMSSALDGRDSWACVYGISLPAMPSTLVGRDHWGLLSIRLACPRCQCPCGATNIWLAVEKIVAHPRSCAFWP